MLEVVLIGFDALDVLVGPRSMKGFAPSHRTAKKARPGGFRYHNFATFNTTRT